MKTAKIFWQSQSGNSYACALKVEETLKEEGYTVELHSMLSKEPVSIEESLLIFVYPVFNFKPATATKEFIHRLEKSPTTKKALAICSCTGIISNTPYILRRLLKNKNIELVGHLKVKSSESYIFLRKYMGSTRKQDGLPDTKSFEIIKNFIKTKILDEFNKEFMFFNPFSFWYWLGALSPENIPGKPYSKRKWVKDKCTLCGFCWKLCPSGSITRNGEELLVNTKTCVGCCGCFNICPSRAWLLSDYEEKYFLKNHHTAQLLKEIFGKDPS